MIIYIAFHTSTTAYPTQGKWIKHSLNKTKKPALGRFFCFVKANTLFSRRHKGSAIILKRL
jgi:hypothetical protein